MKSDVKGCTHYCARPHGLDMDFPTGRSSDHQRVGEHATAWAGLSPHRSVILRLALRRHTGSLHQDNFTALSLHSFVRRQLSGLAFADLATVDASITL